jgi:hypothetical protein
MLTRRQTGQFFGRARPWLTLCYLGLLPALMLRTVCSAHAQTIEGLQITTNFKVERPVTPDTIIELRLSRELKKEEGHLAIVIDRVDVTSQFIIDGLRYVYSPALVPLPLGTTQVLVHRVGQAEVWHEVGRFDLRVVKAAVPTPTPDSLDEPSSQTRDATMRARDSSSEVILDKPLTDQTSPTIPVDTPKTEETQDNERWFGFEKMDYVPSLTIGMKSLPAQFNFPASTRPSERATFTDGTLQFSLRSEMARGPFASQASFDFAGSTFQPEALRFGSLGNEAPQIDLSSYLVQLQLGRAKVAIGHTSFGSARHLINGFSSRGIVLTVPINKRFDFSVAALNGTSVVGYGNFLGLGKSQHQLHGATLGIELLAKRPGGLRVEFSGMRAYIQGLNNISQGSVNDVERSKGGSIRLIATDKTGRFKFEAGFTRSQHRNPADPLLYQGTNTIAIPFLTRNARYSEVSLDVLRGYALTKTKQVNLNVAIRHEQVDPLFKSLGASAGADRRQNDFQLSGSVGEISFQAGHGRFNDNLRRIASILQSLTRSNQLSVALPAAALWGGTSSTSNFLPRLSYSRSETHQFAASIPVNGGFDTDPTSIPNQFSTNESFSADWQFPKLNLSSSYNRSFTNNEQPGRKQSDFLNQSMNARIGFNPTTKLNLNFDLSRDSASDLENVTLSRTWRVGTTAIWNLNKQISWTAGVSNTIAGDRARTNGSRNTEFESQFSYRYGIEGGGLKKVQTQMFIRYSDRYARSHDLIFQISNLTRVKIFNAGLNITLF